jgi:hypothetical protein
VDVHSTLGTLFVIAVVAVLAPVCLALLPGPRIPQVVLLLLGGMLIGPQGLRLGSPENVEILADAGSGSSSSWPATRSTSGCCARTSGAAPPCRGW